MFANMLAKQTEQGDNISVVYLPLVLLQPSGQNNVLEDLCNQEGTSTVPDVFKLHNASDFTIGVCMLC